MFKIAIGVGLTLAVFAYLGSPVPHPGTLDWARAWSAATQAHAAVCR